MAKLTCPVSHLGQPVQTVRHGHRARLEHLFVQVLLLQRREVGFEFVFVDGLGDGHGGDGVADFLGEFVLFPELFPVGGDCISTLLSPPCPERKGFAMK